MRYPTHSGHPVAAGTAALPLPAGSADSGALSPGTRHHGHPLTSYYQYGLGVLALCVHHKRVREEVIQRLLVAEKHQRFGHADGNTVGKGQQGRKRMHGVGT